MGYRILWLAHFIYWLRVHRSLVVAAQCTARECRAWTS
ncbi:hypothetical protein BH10PSE18_BH10PSE18_08080 [soil metagenome]